MEAFWLGVYGLALFAVSALASALYHSRGRRRVEPSPGAWITLRSGGARFRCRFISTKKGKWLATPLSVVGAVAPTRSVGEMLGMFGTPTGVAVFTTRVLGTEGQFVLLAAPTNVSVRDRRISPRVRFEPPQSACLNGAPVQIHNLGTRGALVQGEQAVEHGTEVVLQPEGTVARLTGYVLACDAVGTEYRMRVLFEREVPLSFCWDLANRDAGSLRA
jgi:hypothetical protein